MAVFNLRKLKGHVRVCDGLTPCPTQDQN